MAVHPQSGCVGSGGMAALCCGSFPEDGAGRVAAGLSCDSVRWGLSPCLSVGTRAGAAACSRSFPVHTEAVSQSLAHDGSIGQPLEQGSEEKSGLDVSCWKAFYFFLPVPMLRGEIRAFAECKRGMHMRKCDLS